MNTVHLISEARINPRNYLIYLIRAWNRQALAMCIASSTLTHVGALKNKTSFRTLFILNLLTYHVLQFGYPAKMGPVGHQSDSIEAAHEQTSHMPLHVLPMLQIQMPCPLDCQLHNQ